MADQTREQREAAQREAARNKVKELHIAEYLAKGDRRPTAEIVEPPQPAAEDQDAPTVAALVTKPASRPKPAEKRAPWDAAHPKVQVNFTTRLAESTHMKLTWLADNLPRQSIQKLVHASIDRYVDQLIEEHYKP